MTMTTLIPLVGVQAQDVSDSSLPTSAKNIVRVRYGYFTESRPIHVGCGRRRKGGGGSTTDVGSVVDNGGGSWFDLYDDATDTYYQVICYPQTSGNYALSRLDKSST